MKNKYSGLTKSEVLHNQKLYGKNIVILNKKNKLLKSFLKQHIFLLLVICSILYLLIGEIVYAIIIGVISLLVLLSNIYQQFKITKIKEELKKIKTETCRVIRDNQEIIISSEDVTIDDIILFNEGDKIGADAIILESHDLYADESILVKDNINSPKSYDLLDKEAILKSNYVYKETLILKGNGIAKVTNIGAKTEYGKNIANLSTTDEKSKLQKQMNKIYKIFAIIAIIMLVVVSIISTITGDNLIIGILSGIVVAISSITLITPLTFNLFIYNNILKTAKNNAIIKNIPTIETLNKVSCLCIDKLGIITENKMEVKEFYSVEENKKALLNCALACDRDSSDLYEKAICEYISKNNIEISKDFKLIKQYPFTKETKIMANVYEYNNELYIFVKGTLNGLFDICDIDVEEKYKLHNFQKQLFKKGLEVVAFASNKIKKIETDIFKYNVNFNGILGLYNPPKPNVKECVDTCKQLGIKFIMISEDKKEIASFIGKEIGIDNPNTLPGKELEAISDNELATKIKDIGVFSRITPRHKLKILNSLKDNNEIVIQSGNSVIDSYIMKKANIGVSMNKIGTDVSKEAADLIILDDNFTSIVNTINVARKTNDNAKKLIRSILITNVFLIILTTILTLFSYQILFLPICIITLKMILETLFFIISIKM